MLSVLLIGRRPQSEQRSRDRVHLVFCPRGPMQTAKCVRFRHYGVVIVPMASHTPSRCLSVHTDTHPHAHTLTIKRSKHAHARTHARPHSPIFFGVRAGRGSPSAGCCFPSVVHKPLTRCVRGYNARPSPAARDFRTRMRSHACDSSHAFTTSFAAAAASTYALLCAFLRPPPHRL